MKSLEALDKIQQLGVSVFYTNDAAACWEVSREYASQILRRLAKANQLVHLKREIWGIPNKINKWALPELLISPQPCYLSLQTALYLNNLIDQIPHVIYAVTLGRTKKIKTPLATISFHHITPFLFEGFETDTNGIKIATAEKALIDFLYFQPAKSKLFHSLPELDLSENFSIKKARNYIHKIPSKNRRQMVIKRFEELLD